MRCDTHWHFGTNPYLSSTAEQTKKGTYRIFRALFVNHSIPMHFDDHQAHYRSNNPIRDAIWSRFECIPHDFDQKWNYHRSFYVCIRLEVLVVAVQHHVQLDSYPKRMEISDCNITTQSVIVFLFSIQKEFGQQVVHNDHQHEHGYCLVRHLYCIYFSVPGE